MRSNPRPPLALVVAPAQIATTTRRAGPRPPRRTPRAVTTRDRCVESHCGRTAGTMAFRIGLVRFAVVVHVGFEFEDAGRATRVTGGDQATAEDARR